MIPNFHCHRLPSAKRMLFSDLVSPPGSRTCLTCSELWYLLWDYHHPQQVTNTWKNYYACKHIWQSSVHMKHFYYHWIYCMTPVTNTCNKHLWRLIALSEIFNTAKIILKFIIIISQENWYFIKKQQKQTGHFILKTFKSSQTFLPFCFTVTLLHTVSLKVCSPYIVLCSPY